jgi:hypothetical protein
MLFLMIRLLSRARTRLLLGGRSSLGVFCWDEEFLFPRPKLRGSSVNLRFAGAAGQQRHQPSRVSGTRQPVKAGDGSVVVVGQLLLASIKNYVPRGKTGGC